jgi:alpha-mannosidase
VLDDVLDRLGRDRSLRFHLDGQAILADDYLDVRPGQRARLERLVASGRLTVGPWYVLADELLAGDEPLVRNLLIGRRRSAALGGWLPVGYSPDAFGHPAALPTILRGFGIETALLWRGHGGCGSPDRDLFRWRAPDGAEVLTHHLPPAGYEYGAELPVEGARARGRWRALAAVLEPRAATPVLLVMNGADHHALQPHLGKAVRALRRAAPDATVEVGTLDTYFDAVRAALAAGAVRLATVMGERRAACGHTWVLQGVAATRTALKQRIAEGAALLTRWAEPQVALAMDGADRRPLLERAWRTHLANLSHDVLAGCVGDEVADDAATRARHVIEAARGLLTDALDARLGQEPVRRRRERVRREPCLAVINPSPWAREGILETTVTVERQAVVVGRPAAVAPPSPLAPFHLVGVDGAVVPMQVLGAADAYDRLDSPRDYPESARVWAVRVAARVGAVPALGLVRLDVRAGAAGHEDPAHAVRATRDRLRAPWGEVRARTRGFEVRASRQVLVLEPMLTSERDEGDTYTIEPVAGDRPIAARWGAARIVWGGPLTAALARPFRLGGRVRGTVFVRVDAGSPLVRVIVEGVNRAGNHRVRLALPLRARDATADMAFGAESRPRVRAGPVPFPREHPPTTAPMHRYVSAGGWTAFARGLHEYELLPDGSLAITLVRAVGDLSRGSLRARPGHAGWPTATPGAQGIGPFRVELAIAPVSVTPRSAARHWDAVEALADAFHVPLAGCMCRAGIEVPPRVPGPRLEGRGFAFKALKPRDEGPGVVLRCVNLTGRPQRGSWVWPGPVNRAYRARLDETVESELRLSADRRIVAFTAKPREVVTVVVET